MTMITPSYLGETIEYSSLHACRSTLEDPTHLLHRLNVVFQHRTLILSTLYADAFASAFPVPSQKCAGSAI